MGGTLTFFLRLQFLDMKSLVVFPLLFAICFSLEVTVDTIMSDPHAFSSLMHSLSSGEVQKTVDDITALLVLGENARDAATATRDAALGVRDAARGVRDAAQDDLTSILGALQTSNEEASRLQGELTNTEALIVTREEEKRDADEKVVNEQSELAAEEARIDSEAETLRKVLTILQGFLAEETPEKQDSQETTPEEPGESLLATATMSRTATLLSNPSFIATLVHADPAVINQVIGLVEGLLQNGEDDRQKAIGERDAAVTAASVAAQNVVDAQATKVRIEGDLADEGITIQKLESDRDSSQGILNDKQVILDDAERELGIKQALLDDETARIDGEKGILDDAHGKLVTLVEVITTLE